MKKFFSQQNQMLDSFFSRALAQGIFPGAASAVILGDYTQRRRMVNCWGDTSYRSEDKQAISEETYFDLASLTKPLATLPALLHLMTTEKFNFDTTLEDLLVVKMPPDKQKITLKDILTHRSGLAAYFPFYQEVKAGLYRQVKKEIIELIRQTPLVYPPGSRSLYSDLGYILAGFIIEQLSGKNLNTFLDENIYRPLGLEKKIFFNLTGRIRPGIYAAGEYCLWRRRVLRGEVGDENCALLGGAAGHAGLFGSITGVMQLLEYLFDLGWEEEKIPAEKKLFKSEILRRCCRKWDLTGTNTWAVGFDTPSPRNSSGGPYLSGESIGHLGYAGTSFWLDPQKKVILVLLTNRVHPCRSNNKIKKIRPRFHQLVMEQLELTHM
ncbi:serine hydrolase domain-containing protein [Desulfurivibrio alkaliphilus]|nr:serine hydrolase [Desulfurivibrio alkaliphilus]